MNKKILLILIMFFVCLAPIQATRIPTQDSSIYVNDYAEVIDDTTKQQLISTNQQSDYQYGGYVVVATFDFVEDDLYDFSYKLFNQWGIGDDDNNNGVLLVLDIGNDNYCYILGSGIEKILSDSQAKSIIDNYMEEDFANKNYSQAVLKTSNQFLKVIESGNYTVSDSSSSSLISGFNIMKGVISVGVIALLIILIVVASIFTPHRRRYRRMPPPMRGPEPRGPRRMSGPGRMPGPPMGGRGPSHSSRPSGGFSGRPGGGFSGGPSGGSHHSGGSSRGAGGTRH